MRALTNTEQAMLRARQQTVKRWILRYAHSPSFAPLALFRADDTNISLVMANINLLAKMVLFEPTGDIPHHLLNTTVWGYVRTEMRIPPETRYRRMSYQSWYDAYNDSNRRYQSNWYRSVIPTGDGEITAIAVPVTDVQAAYHSAVTQKKVLDWLGYGALRILPLEETPNPAQPLAIENAMISQRAGQQSQTLIRAVGGTTPYTYAIVGQLGRADQVAAVFSTASGVTHLGIAVVLTTRPGTYTATIQVTDAAGDVATANLTLTVTAARP